MFRARPPRGESVPTSRMAELFPGSLESVIALSLSALVILASVAFLRQDRPALEAAYARLMSLPVPDYFTRAAERYAVNYPDLPPLTWPLNRDKVEGFLACFDRPYREAYVCDAEGNVLP